MEGSIANLLKRTREQKRVNAATAASACRLSEKQILALESGDLSVFKAKVYARGAFTNYAKYLEVHSRSRQNSFERLIADQHQPERLSVLTPSTWLQSRLTPRVFLALGIIVFGLFLSSYVVNQAVRYFALPELVLLSPKSNTTIHQEVMIDGTTEPDAFVTVNEEQVPVDEDGYFTTSVFLSPGINILQVSATNAAGRSNIITKDILVPVDEVQ